MAEKGDERVGFFYVYRKMLIMYDIIIQINGMLFLHIGYVRTYGNI